MLRAAAIGTSVLFKVCLSFSKPGILLVVNAGYRTQPVTGREIAKDATTG
jgi:hypothetical protein